MNISGVQDLSNIEVGMNITAAKISQILRYHIHLASHRHPGHHGNPAHPTVQLRGEAAGTALSSTEWDCNFKVEYGHLETILENSRLCFPGAYKDVLFFREIILKLQN